MHAQTSDEIQNVEIGDVNEEQQEELTNLKDEMYVILKEEESIRIYVEEKKITLRVAATYSSLQAADAHRRLEAGGTRGRCVIVFDD